MSVTFIKRSIFQRILGKPVTQEPQVENCWSYADGKLVINLSEASELQDSNGAIRLEGNNLPVRVLVVRSENGEYRAYHNRCTHLAHRRLDPVPGTNTVQCCSINKSTFDESGDAIFGPAPHSIKSYPVELDGENLIVSLG